MTKTHFMTSLGLELSNDDRSVPVKQYIRAVRKGIPGSVVQRFVERFDNREVVARVLSTSPGNLSRQYKVERLSKARSEELLDTMRLYEKAASIFDSSELVKEWMQSQIPALSGASPESLMDTFEGRRWIGQTLDAIERGEFT